MTIITRATTYKTASMGSKRGWILRHVKAIFVTLIVLFLIVEVVLRILWRTVNSKSESYILIISLYYLFISVVLLIVIVSFLFWGLRLYKNLAGFENVNPIVKERVRRVRK